MSEGQRLTWTLAVFSISVWAASASSSSWVNGLNSCFTGAFLGRTCARTPSRHQCHSHQHFLKASSTRHSVTAVRDARAH